ncbi:MAG: hypothetical protein ACKOSQ_04490 [Planctomycetaceae bacterium]
MLTPSTRGRDGGDRGTVLRAYDFANLDEAAAAAREAKGESFRLRDARRRQRRVTGPS